MLKKEIDTIIELCEMLKSEYNSQFFAPADENVICEWEVKNDIVIPELYKEWLHFSDGAIIRGMLARFYGIQGFEVNNPDYPVDCVIIGDLIGDGERLGFSKTTGKILRINHGRIREYDDFASFLNKVIIRMLRR